MHLEHVDVLVITIIKYIPIISVYGMCHLFNYIYPCLCRAIYSSLIHRLHMYNVCALTYVCISCILYVPCYRYNAIPVVLFSYKVCLCKHIDAYTIRICILCLPKHNVHACVS